MILLTNLSREQESHFVFLEGSNHLILRLHNLLDRISSFLLGTSIEGNVAAGSMLTRKIDIGCQ